MQRSIHGSETEKNIVRAFVGESQARNRYDMMAAAAKKEGFVHIMKTFEGNDYVVLVFFLKQEKSRNRTSGVRTC